MHLVDERQEKRFKTPVHPGCAVLRRAVRGNIVSFPSQVVAFLRHPPADMQRRVVLLFFVHGWSAVTIAARFNVPKHVIWGILNEWSVRALALGYIQVIDPEAYATCCRVDDEYETNREADRFVNAPVREEVRVHAFA
ncbi:MAG: hypothetical protein ABSG79_15480 [Bryobacteraceae bacterium]|jgi:hypothetical protein